MTTVGETDITNFILLNRARQVLNVPFIASGGMADGYSLHAALALGASGINCGQVPPDVNYSNKLTNARGRTRFMCTIEAPIHQNIKEGMYRLQASQWLNLTLQLESILMTWYRNRQGIREQYEDIDEKIQKLYQTVLEQGRQ